MVTRISLNLTFHYLFCIGLVLGGLSNTVLASPKTTGIAPAAKVAQINPTTNLTNSNVKAALVKLDNLAQENMRRTGIPGMAIAVVYQDQVVYLKGFGIREAGKPDPVDEDTVFQLASLSKPIASTVVASVVGTGKVKWNDPIILHDQTFQMDVPYLTQSVTLKDMFSHRSGLPLHAGDLLEDLGFDWETILARLRYLPTDNHFRSQYAYTNFGLTAAAMATAKAEGTTWAELSTEKLYRPLGMNSTSSNFSDYISAQNRALTHVYIDNQWVPRYVRNPDNQTPAGGVSSSVRDLAKWMRLQLGNGQFEGKLIVDPDALAETHRPQIVSNRAKNPSMDRASFYGLGWGVGYTDRGLVRLSHSGAFLLGAATTVNLLPGESLGIAVLTNAAPIGVPETIAASFLDLVQTGQVQKDYAKLLQEAFADLNTPAYGTEIDYTKRPEQFNPSLPLKTYAGTYRNDYFGKIAIVVKEDQLILRMGPQQRDAFPLKHYNQNTFIYQPKGENAFGPSALEFTISDEGKLKRVMIENLNIKGQGTFEKIVGS